MNGTVSPPWSQMPQRRAAHQGAATPAGLASHVRPGCASTKGSSSRSCDHAVEAERCVSPLGASTKGSSPRSCDFDARNISEPSVVRLNEGQLTKELRPLPVHDRVPHGDLGPQRRAAHRGAATATLSVGRVTGWSGPQRRAAHQGAATDRSPVVVVQVRPASTKGSSPRSCDAARVLSPPRGPRRLNEGQLTKELRLVYGTVNGRRQPEPQRRAAHQGAATDLPGRVRAHDQASTKGSSPRSCDLDRLARHGGPLPPASTKGSSPRSCDTAAVTPAASLYREPQRRAAHQGAATGAADLMLGEPDRASTKGSSPRSCDRAFACPSSGSGSCRLNEGQLTKELRPVADPYLACAQVGASTKGSSPRSCDSGLSCRSVTPATGLNEGQLTKELRPTRLRFAHQDQGSASTKGSSQRSCDPGRRGPPDAFPRSRLNEGQLTKELRHLAEFAGGGDDLASTKGSSQRSCDSERTILSNAVNASASTKGSSQRSCDRPAREMFGRRSPQCLNEGQLTKELRRGRLGRVGGRRSRSLNEGQLTKELRPQPARP